MKLIITGVSGMVGEGVMHICLNDKSISSVLNLGRKSSGINNIKLQEAVIADLMDLDSVENDLRDYDACLFCLGISSLGMTEAAYYETTHTLTMHIAHTLIKLNPNMVFCYVSGQGTDSTERGSTSWARVKGKVENDLNKLPFKKVYAYRPGFIKPIDGLKNIKPYYKYITWLYPVGRLLFPNGFNTLEELAKSMIYVSRGDYNSFILNGKEITETAILQSLS